MTRCHRRHVQHVESKLLSNGYLVMPELPAAPLSLFPDPQIVIECPSCHGSVTAPATMAGQTGACPYCRQHIVIQEKMPDLSSAKMNLESLESQLKENLTQITELRGNVSRLNTELHRHQIRMKTLSERQVELQSGIAAARAEIDSV